MKLQREHIENDLYECDLFTILRAILFTFLATPRGFNIGLDVLLPEYLPSYFNRKWLMITILPVIYGVMRYLQDIYEKKEGESPDKVLLSDKPLLSSVKLLLVVRIHLQEWKRKSYILEVCCVIKKEVIAVVDK